MSPTDMIANSATHYLQDSSRTIRITIIYQIICVSFSRPSAKFSNSFSHILKLNYFIVLKLK